MKSILLIRIQEILITYHLLFFNIILHSQVFDE